MHITSTPALHHHHRTLTTLAVATLGVIVTMGVLSTTHELRTDGAAVSEPRPPTVEGAPTVLDGETPSLLEGDPQAFDHAVAVAATASGRTTGPVTLPGMTSPGGTPSLLEGDHGAFEGAHGAFEAAIADELAKLRLNR